MEPVPEALLSKQLAQLEFGLIQDPAALGGKASTAVDMEIRHRHGGLKRLGFAAVAGQRRALQGKGNLLRLVKTPPPPSRVHRSCA